MYGSYGTIHPFFAVLTSRVPRAIEKAESFHVFGELKLDFEKIFQFFKFSIDKQLFGCYTKYGQGRERLTLSALSEFKKA